MTVLLVEDHADTRSVLEMLLNRCGCQTVTSKNLKDARARLKEMSFDMLISDLNLPDGDGLDLVREAKQTHKLKAIAITGRTSDEERDRGL
jgi:DNA-binding response OmpR family regulator